MQTLKKYYFGKQKVKVPNTFIGGIGATINTPALLASKLGIAENRIKLFKVTGVDVECAVVGGSYSMPVDCWVGNTSITYWEDNVCNYTNRNVFRNASNLTYCIMNAVITVTTGSSHIFQGCTSLKKILLPECTHFGGYYMLNSVPFNIFYGPKMITAFGDSTGNDACFDINGTGALILNPALQTCNAGQPDGDLQNAVTRGYSVRYVTNFTPPNAITDLSSGTIYNTAIQLNFTPPSSTNGVDFYECYVDGKLMNEIKNSGDFITGLTPNTAYKIEVKAVDMFYNKSDFSNAVNVTTTNRVATDVDAIAYINASSNTLFQDVIDDAFKGLKTQGLYNKIQAFYPFLGTTQAQHKWNAKNPQDTNAAFRLQFFGGGTHSDLGYQCNGTNAYANTFLVPSAIQNVNSNGLTVTVGTNNSVIPTDAWEIGAYISNTQCSLLTSRNNNTTFLRQTGLNTTTYALQSGINDAKGVYTGTKTASNLHKLIRNKSVIATGTGGGILPTNNIFIGTISVNTNPNTSYSSQRMQFTAIHEGLTDSEVVALHTIIDNFESAIGRKTW